MHSTPDTVVGAMSATDDDRSATPGLRALGLRGRTAVAVAVAALSVSIAGGVIAHQVLRRYLVDQRVDAAITETVLNATDFRSAVVGGQEVTDAVFKDATNASPTLVRTGEKWFSSVPAYDAASVPTELRQVVAQSGSASMVTHIEDDPHVVVGVDVETGAATDTEYYQLFDLSNVDSSLASLRNAIVLAVAAATGTAALVTSSVARRVLRPLRVTADAAQQIASGQLETRLDAERDPDLAPLVAAFNNMAESLQDRIDRERRFATDVSHELRTPLAAMTSAVALMRRRQAELSPTALSALDELDRRTRQFSQLALDVLDISRLEVDLVSPEPQWTSVGELVGVVTESGPSERVEVGIEPDTACRVDPRPLRIIVRNLVENADRYAGGVSKIFFTRAGSDLVIDVDDAGPGVEEHEREAIFERFHRGAASAEHPSVHGNGLGLALVAENARALGGAVSVARSNEGGARFRVSVPVAWRGNATTSQPAPVLDEPADEEEVGS